MTDQFISKRREEIKRQKTKQTIFSTMFAVIALVLCILIFWVLGQIGYFPEQVSALNTLLAPTPTITLTPTVTATLPPTSTGLPTITPSPSPTYTQTPIPPVRGIALGNVYIREIPENGVILQTLHQGDEVLVDGYWGDEQSGWYRVILGAKQGWVVRNMIKLLSSLPKEFETFPPSQ